MKKTFLKKQTRKPFLIILPENIPEKYYDKIILKLFLTIMY
jgi:hypothetical protein